MNPAMSQRARSRRSLPFIARLIAAQTLVAGAVLSADPASAEIKSFRDWVAACDNTRTCSAYGFDSGSTGSAYLRLERGGGADAALRITIAVDVQDGSAFELSFDDPAIAGLPPETVAGKTSDQDDVKRLVISNPQVVEPMLAGLRKAKTLVVTRVDPPGATPSDPAITEISLAGFAAATLWIDEEQKRIGTVTALIGRGDKPTAAVPAVPALPVVVATKRSTGPTPKKAPAAVIAKARAVCEDKTLREADDATRLGANEVMYWFQCAKLSGAYNFYNALVLDSPGKPVRVAEFRMPPELTTKGRDAVETNINAGFDEETQTLSLLNKGRGVSDCGTTSDWVWDGAAFRMIAAKSMPDCKGVPLGDWPTLFRAERR